GVTSLVLAGAGAAAAPTASAADHPAAPATAVTAPATAPATAASRVLLITGMQFGFRAGPGGRPEPMMLPTQPGSAGRAMPVIGLSRGGLSLEIPADALPYLGHGLDRSLFDLKALYRLEHGGRLPV